MNEIKLKNINVIANAIRLEIDPLTNDFYLVFKIIDENFKKRLRENWKEDIDLKLVEK
jgi:hypothetical protein